MQKWINITGQYIYPTMIGDLVMQRLAPQIGVFAGVTNEDVVAASVPIAAHQLDLIAMSLQGDQPHLAAEFSLADIFVATVTHYIGLTPEGAAPLEARPVVGEWISRITSRPSYANAAYDLGF